MFKYLQIETTTFCNATCWFCPNHLVPKEHMELDLIYKIIDDTRDMGIVYRPFGLGEPLVDTRLPDIARYIKEDPPPSKKQVYCCDNILYHMDFLLG